jgi:hypothetical protein
MIGFPEAGGTAYLFVLKRWSPLCATPPALRLSSGFIATDGNKPFMSGRV